MDIFPIHEADMMLETETSVVKLTHDSFNLLEICLVRH
jgi:hypothetical protein